MPPIVLVAYVSTCSALNRHVENVPPQPACCRLRHGHLDTLVGAFVGRRSRVRHHLAGCLRSGRETEQIMRENLDRTGQAHVPTADSISLTLSAIRRRTPAACSQAEPGCRTAHRRFWLFAGTTPPLAMQSGPKLIWPATSVPSWRSASDSSKCGLEPIPRSSISCGRTSDGVSVMPDEPPSPRNADSARNFKSSSATDFPQRPLRLRSRLCCPHFPRRPAPRDGPSDSLFLFATVASAC